MRQFLQGIPKNISVVINQEENKTEEVEEIFIDYKLESIQMINRLKLAGAGNNFTEIYQKFEKIVLLKRFLFPLFSSTIFDKYDPMEWKN